MKFALGAAVLLCLILLGSLTSHGQNLVNGEGDFRSTHWGQSPADIEILEEVPPLYRDESLLIFHDRFLGIPTEVIYFFLDGRLIMGLTHLMPDHDDLNSFFSDYERVKAVIGQNLGTPDRENWQFYIPDLQSDRSLWAEALGFGMIKVEAGWLVPGTGIAIRLSGGNLKGHLTTIHFSTDDMNAGRLAYKEYFGREIGVPNQYFQGPRVSQVSLPSKLSP